MFRKTVLAAVLGSVAIGAVAQEAHAGKKDSPYYQDSYVTRGPTHGYEGFSRFGGYNYYCSYIRKPIRRCYWNGSREKCKVVAWRTTQICQQ